MKQCAQIFSRSPNPFGIARVDLDESGQPADFCYEYLNDAMAGLTSDQPGDLVGRSSSEIWPEGEGAQVWFDMFYRAAYEGETTRFESVSFPLKRFFSVVAFPVARGYCAFELQDVMTWVSDSRLTFEGMSAAMFFYDLTNDLMMLTPSAQDICGVDATYVSGPGFAEDALDAPSAAQMREQVVRLKEQGEQMLCDLRLKDERWVRVSLAHTGKTNQFAHGFLEDITHMVEMEQHSVRRSEIIESLSSEDYALYLVDLDKDRMVPYILRNEVAEYFAKTIKKGMPYSEWLDMYCERYVVESDRQRVADQIGRDAMLERLVEHAGDFSISCRRVFGDEEQYVELRLVRLSGDANEMVLAARNINAEVMEQISQKEALRSALVLAEHASEAKSTFLTNISHDFRTPLNSIMGFANIALLHLDEAERVRSCLEKILVSSDHLLELINDILDVSRIESGKIVLSEQPLDLMQLMEGIRNLFMGQAQERGVELSVDASGVEHAAVLGDQLRMNQILVNTVGNALKYTDPGGRVDVVLTEGAAAPNGVTMYEMVVRDTGCGMSEEFMKRIFMPFERDSAGSAHVAEGTGLGMTITKNLVDLLGGAIAVESAPGRGSTFTITLPLKPGGQRHAGAEGASGGQEAELRMFDGFRVLVADDDELSRELVSEVLRDRGFEIDQVSDGDEALDKLEASDEGFYDAVIMDMRMPRMAGDVAARAMRLLPRADVAGLPIIAATADAFEEGHRRSREAGMTAHITKPLNIKELIGVLEACLHPADRG